MKQIFYAPFVFFLLASCNLINPDEQEPAFVQVGDYQLTTQAGQGTASEKITEMWLYSNDNIVSITPNGSSTPLLNKGKTKISVRAGIKNNGASDMRIYYPFYAPYDTVLQLSSLEHHTIHPRFTYYENVNIDASRNFESGSNFLEVSGVNQGLFEWINDPAVVFEGTKCAKASLTGDQQILFFKDNNPIDIASGNTVFLEMNYSCNQPFIVGISSIVGSTTHTNDMVIINGTNDGSTPHWNKIYIDLGPVGILYPQATQHEIYIYCKRTGADPAIIYLDNLKLVSW